MNKSYVLMSLILLLSSGAKLLCMQQDGKPSKKHILLAAGHPAFNQHREAIDDEHLMSQSVQITPLSKDERKSMREISKKVKLAEDARDTNIELNVSQLKYYIDQWTKRANTLSVAEAREVHVNHVAKFKKALEYLEQQEEDGSSSLTVTEPTPTGSSSSSSASAEVTEQSEATEPEVPQAMLQSVFLMQNAETALSEQQAAAKSKEAATELAKLAVATEKQAAEAKQKASEENAARIAEMEKQLAEAKQKAEAEEIRQEAERATQIAEAKKKAEDAQKLAQEEATAAAAKVAEAYKALSAKQADKTNALTAKQAEIAKLEEAQQARQKRSEELTALNLAHADANVSNEAKPMPEADRAKLTELQAQVEKDLQEAQAEEAKLAQVRTEVGTLETSLQTVNAEIEKLAHDNPELAKQVNPSNLPVTDKGCNIL